MPIFETHLDGRGPVYEQIYRDLRDAILEGRLQSGRRLPSTRDLASELRVSRGTVLCAFEQLLAEGYVISRVGAGTFVAEPSPDLPDERASKGNPMRGSADTPVKFSRWGQRLQRWRPRKPHDALDARKPVEFDLRPCLPDVQGLPSLRWRRCVSRVAARRDPSRLGYGDPAGSLALRREVASYLGRVRGVRCEAKDVLVLNGVAQCLDLAIRMLTDEGDSVLLEDPHYPGAHRALVMAGIRACPLPVDHEGANLEKVPRRIRASTRLTYVTPSHQFPTGVVMSLPRRQALLEWANDAGAWILEDDYDSEFRYARRPIQAMKSLDREDRVIYMGTFSKILYPGLRLAYMVLPEALLDSFREGRWVMDWSCPVLEQEALAEFLANGDLERHVRRARTLYGKRRSSLLAALRKELGNRVRFRDTRAGLHLMVEIPEIPQPRTQAFVQESLRHGVAVYAMDDLFCEPPPTCHLMLGFAGVAEDAIQEGVARLKMILGRLER